MSDLQIHRACIVPRSSDAHIRKKPTMKKINEILRYAVNHFGEVKQQVVAIEEMAELTQALSKMIIDHPKKCRDNVVEELADVEIMLGQLKIIHGIREDELEYKKEYKLARLMEIVGFPNN